MKIQSSDKKCCVFGDLAQVATGRAKCDRHGQVCLVKAYDLNLTGFSCKDVTKYNMGAMKQHSSTILSKNPNVGESSTRKTFYAQLELNKTHRPLVVLLENTDNIDDKPSESSATAKAGDKSQSCSNSSQVLDEYEAHGWSGGCMILDSQEFSVPHARRRAFFVMIDTMQTRASMVQQPKDFFAAVFERVLAFRRAPPTLDDVFLDDHHPAVMAELVLRLKDDGKESDGAMQEPVHT